MSRPILLYFEVYICFCVLVKTVTTFIQKNYAVNTCVRDHTVLELFIASTLRYSFSNNPPVCSYNSSISPDITTTSKRFSQKSFDDVHFGINSFSNKKLMRKKRQTLTWRTPDGMPPGTSIAFCNSSNCCIPKKTLNVDGTTYNLCRECVHVITLPASYSPRIHNYVTCQDTDYYETCLTGEGSCTTNTLPTTVSFQNQTVTFMFGKSCSCEIRTDSIFADFI
ncbi:uncharacterized protein T16H12.9 isoform X1 [Hydra vulgaris]|uniref:uncharacterized protein T16H12.9 isoform X1 n=1 Tax=Hydra vulgaris TaxID=6087 RepID=UPI001F5EFAFF|nr:uncharacterized protein T16H12.9 [Hydra vulgaris]